MRSRAVLWRIAVLVVWVGVLAALIWLSDGELVSYVVLGPPVTVLVGAVVYRSWVLLAPLVVSAVLAIVTLVSFATCDCYVETGVGVQFLYLLLLFTIPAVTALALGLGLRRLTRFLRAFDDGPDPEPT